MSNAEIQMTEIKQPKPFRRIKCKLLPTIRVRIKADGPKSPVIIINEKDFDSELHTKVGRVPLKPAQSAAGEGTEQGE